MKISSRRMRLAAVVLGTAAIVAGCSSPGTTTPTAAPATAAASDGAPATAAPAKSEYNIALIRWDPADIYFNGVQLGQEIERDRIQAAEGVKINFTVFGKNDAGEQLTALQAQIAKGVDGVDIVPWRGEAMTDVVTQLRSDNIPVVTHNAYVPKAPQVFVAFDNFRGGQLGGETIKAVLDKNRGADWPTKGGVIIELRCIITASFDIGRHDGYHSVFDPIVAANPNVKIETREAGCNDSQARKAVDDLISRYGKDQILAIASIDGTMGIGGGATALASAGMKYAPDDPKYIPITTIDASKPELEALAKCDMTSAAEQPALAEGMAAMRLMWEMIKSGTTLPSSATSAEYAMDDFAGSPWLPIKIIQSDKFDGPWYQTQGFAVPQSLALDDHGHWANVMDQKATGSWPVYAGDCAK
ncbi:MAG: sugar ABC transporter substrate-binding protein [Candidatus Limnocylindrales bacterium]